MTSIRYGLVLLLTLALLPAARAAAIPRERVVAVVDREPVTYGELYDFVERDLMQLEMRYGGEELGAKTDETLRAGVEVLVRRELLLLEGKRLAKESPAINAQVEELVERNLRGEQRKYGGEAAFNAALREKGVTRERYRQQLKDELLREYVRYTRIPKAPAPAPRDLRAYYDTHRDEFRGPREVRYRQIFLPYSAFATPAAAGKQAVFIANLLAGGASFAFLAKQFSRGPRAAQAGLWDFNEWGGKGEALRQRILALEEGRCSAPVEDRDGIYLFRAETVHAEGLRPFEVAAPRIQERMEEEAKQRAGACLYEELERRFYVKRFPLAGKDGDGEADHQSARAEPAAKGAEH